MPAVGRAGDSLWLPRVTSLRGHIALATPDTVYLRLLSAVGDRRRLAVPVNWIVSIPRSTNIAVRQEDPDRGRGAGILVLAVLATGIALVIAWAHGMSGS